MNRVLFVSDCEYCNKCAGICRPDCPRYAYWVPGNDVHWDSPHCTWLWEEEARKKAEANPTGDCAHMCASADNY